MMCAKAAKDGQHLVVTPAEAQVNDPPRRQNQCTAELRGRSLYILHAAVRDRQPDQILHDARVHRPHHQVALVTPHRGLALAARRLESFCDDAALALDASALVGNDRELSREVHLDNGSAGTRLIPLPASP